MINPTARQLKTESRKTNLLLPADVQGILQPSQRPRALTKKTSYHHHHLCLKACQMKPSVLNSIKNHKPHNMTVRNTHAC